MLFTSDGICYVGYSCNIPDSYHLRISHLIGRNVLVQHRHGRERLRKSMIFAALGSYMGEFFLLHRETCFWSPAANLFVEHLLVNCEDAVAPRGNTAACCSGVGHTTVDKSIAFSRLSAETRTQSIEMVEWSSIHRAFPFFAQRERLCHFRVFLDLSLNAWLAMFPSDTALFTPLPPLQINRFITDRRRWWPTCATRPKFPAWWTSALQTAPSAKVTGINRREGEINREEETTHKCCHGDSLARRLKDAGSWSRPGGQHRSREPRGGR